MIIKRERSPLAIILLAVLLVVIACVSLTFGQIDVPVGKALAVIGSQLNLPGFTEADYTREQLAVIWYIRLPRMLVGVLVGAALGISGAVMQGIFSNPLADPGLIGRPQRGCAGRYLLRCCDRCRAVYCFGCSLWQYVCYAGLRFLRQYLRCVPDGIFGDA